MALEHLQEINNFEQWLLKINEIIDALGASDELASQLLEALSEAMERNQTSEYLGTPASSLELPDGRIVENIWSWNWNDYSSNGVYWIPWNAQLTLNPPLNQQKSGMCWVASGGAKGPVVQLALIFKDSPASGELSSTPTLAIRYGAAGESSPAWKPWIEIPNRKFVENNFLNKTTETLQQVKAPVKLLNTLDVAENAVFNANALIKNRLILKGTTSAVIVQADDEANGSHQASSFLTMEVAPVNQQTDAVEEPNVQFNLPLWSMSTGQRVPSSGMTRYVEPFWIDKVNRTANINGTAEYANFIVPENMISEFRSYNIAYDDLWKPATAKSVKDLFDWTNETFLPLRGGVLSGVVRHEQDIFLEHLQGVPENRTAAIRSVVRPLQLQCQGSTHLVSNSKHASLYLEKEDADSAEYTTEHHDASFIFRKVSLNVDLCREADPNFLVLNSDPELDGYWHCHLGNGILKVFANGHWEFTANERLLDGLGPNDTLNISIFYRVVNAVSGSAIAARCQYDVKMHSGDPASISGELSINDIHYQIAVTDTDWTGLPITSKSRLASGSVLAAGSTVAAGSILNGILQDEEWTVDGLQASFGMKEEDDNGVVTESDAILAPGTIIKKGSTIVTESIINRQRWANDSITNTDIQVSVESTLAKGSILKNESVIGLNSVINGFQYMQETVVDGEEIAEESELTSGSKILIGSLISTASSLNGIPGRSGFLDVVQGADSSELNGSLANDSTILEGSILAPGSIVNDFEYAQPTVVTSKIVVDGRAVIAHGSRLAIGSWIEKGSVLNGLQWANGMKAYGMDASVPLSEADIAPILYTRIYANIEGKWQSWWEKSTFKSIYPTASSFDAEMWYNWIENQINALEVEDEFREGIMRDLRKSLRREDRIWTYPIRRDPDILFTHGSWMLDIASLSAPDHVFETRCYVASHSRHIGVDRILVQPFEVVFDSTGAVSERIPAHDAVMIYNEGTSIHPQFLAHAFEYFNFDVVSGIGSEYVVRYDTRLIPEQKNLNQKKLMEILVFTAYSDDINASNEPVATFEKTVSLDVEDMMGAPFIVGARTRTGITSTGQLGDPLYDLGCIEINEDSIALKIRKKSVSMQSEIKETMSLIFERNVDDSGTSANDEYTGIPKEQMAFHPSVDKVVDLGTGRKQFRNVYFSGSPIVSSDQTLKTEITDFPESLMKKWSKVKWTSFKFKDAVEEKGKKSARIHAGVIAQDVQKALKGLDISKWSFFCKDKWNDEKEYEWIDVPAGKDEFGVWREAHTERRIVTSQKAGERYSIRYQEMQAIENAYLRREIELLKKEIELLKKKVN